MRIKDEFKKAGYFWLPTAPDRKIPGMLVITDGGNIELEVIGLFDESIEGFNRLINKIEKLERINGHIENHGMVTLDDCFYKNYSISFGGISKSTILVNKAFLGVACEDKEVLLFNSLKFSVEGIDDWVGVSGIKVKHKYKERIASITYKPPKEIAININNGMKLLITFSWTLPGFPNQKEAKITQKTYFKLTSEQARPLDDFTTAAYKINTLLCFSIDQTVCIEKVTATSESVFQEISDGRALPVQISIYYKSLLYTKKEPKIEQNRMLFRFGQIAKTAERIINNWFDAYEQIDAALGQYFSAKAGEHNYLNGKFLALAQGLETYHRRTSSEMLMAEEVFEKLTKELIVQCPEERKEWLYGRLQYGNELNLRWRIKNMIEPFKEIIGKSKERNKMISSIVDTRNYLTHYDKSLETKAANGKDLWLLCQKMEAIFQLHLLQVLGFTKSEVRYVYENSNELKSKLKEI